MKTRLRAWGDSRRGSTADDCSGGTARTSRPAGGGERSFPVSHPMSGLARGGRILFSREALWKRSLLWKSCLLWRTCVLWRTCAWVGRALARRSWNHARGGAAPTPSNHRCSRRNPLKFEEDALPWWTSSPEGLRRGRVPWRLSGRAWQSGRPLWRTPWRAGSGRTRWMSGRPSAARKCAGRRSRRSQSWTLKRTTRDPSDETAPDPYPLRGARSEWLRPTPPRHTLGRAPTPRRPNIPPLRRTTSCVDRRSQEDSRLTVAPRSLTSRFRPSAAPPGSRG